MFLIRSHTKTYNTVLNPTVVYDCKNSVLYKIGEKEDMEKYYNSIQNVFREMGLIEIANDTHLMELPKNQEIVDKVFQICDYVGVLHAEIYKT